MVGKRIVIVVIAVLLFSCLNVAALADSVSQYSDAGGYDENSPMGGVHGDRGIKAAPPLYRAPGVFPDKYFSTTVCPHCGATGSVYIFSVDVTLAGYQYAYDCRRCTCRWVAGSDYGAFLRDRHFHIVDGVPCPFDYGIDYGFKEDGKRWIRFYCSKHKVYYGTPPDDFYKQSELFAFNTFWGLRVIGGDNWSEPISSTPSVWETPFVPPYDSFATFEPVSIDTIGNKVDDMSLIVKVVYDSFPYFVTLLAIAIAGAFLVVVVKG